MAPHREAEEVDAARTQLSEGEKVLLRAINTQKLAQERQHQENKGEYAELRARLDRVIEGFPGADPEGHRRFHDQLIAESHARTVFWRDLRGRLIEKGVWAVIATICTALWFYFKEKA